MVAHSHPRKRGRAGDTLVVLVVDQAAVVTPVARLNDLGIAVERVTLPP
jgi:hypothetical protein